MNEFKTKWQVCAARARQAAVTCDDSPPLGFATRVAARVADEPGVKEMGLWERMALSSLAATLLLLVMCAAVELPHFRDSQPLDPRIGDSVAQLVWSL